MLNRLEKRGEQLPMDVWRGREAWSMLSQMVLRPDAFPILPAKIMTRYVFPSPFAQKVNPFFSERLAGSHGASPGRNMAPAQERCIFSHRN